MSNKNVHPIKIKITTNINKEPFELKYSNIYDPVPGIRPRRINISDYPYFTADVKYDEKLLALKPYSELLSIFFDKQEFIKVILKDSDESVVNALVSEQVKMKNANTNIMTMLKLIFPTSYPTKNNINTSYNKYLLKQGPSITFDISDVKRMFSFGEMTELGKHDYSYLKINSGICTVSEVIWLNDVLNNKLYRELIERLIEYNEWRKKRNVIIDEDIKTATEQLQNGLNPKGIGSGTGDLIIDETAQNDLASQKRIYNPDDIKEDMVKIIKKYLNIDSDAEKTRKFDEELSYMIEYFIDKRIKNTNKTPITQLVRFKDKFDFTYKKIQDETIDLFTLHKRYDGKDRSFEINKLNKEKMPKQIEIDNLMNGHTMSPVKPFTFVFGQTQLKKYLENLKGAIDYINDNPFNGNMKKDIKNEIERIINENINYPDGMNFFKITNNSSFSGIISIKGNMGQEKTLTYLNESYDDANAYLNTLNEKIKELTYEVSIIDLKIDKLSRPTEELFVFNGETDVPKEPISQLKKDNGPEITKMQEEIFKYVITRYNRYQGTIRSAELSGQYVEIDTAIDIIIDEIKKLNTLVKSSAITADQILNITEPIKNSFDKLVAGNKIAISRKIGEKLAQIIKLSNQIKFLTQLQTIFFKEPATGIFVEYEKTLDPNDSFTKLAIGELKQEKYSNLKKIIDYIKEKFLKNNVVSLNSNLTKLFKEYIENKNNGFYDQVVEPANKLLNLGKPPELTDLEPLWNISVISMKSDTLGTEYDISVYMDVIEGEVNATNQSEIKCQFFDEELTRRFEELTDDVPVYGPGLYTKVFSVKKAKEERAKHEDEKKKEIASTQSTIVKQKNGQTPKAIPVSGGEKRYTKSFRRMSNNQNNTKKRLGL